MPLILAIEPDRRQAARVAALTRGALDAELVVADSTESATAALKGREPDLILTSLLLSPKEEAGLRAFDRGGVPVPTLVIPVLASTSPGRSRNGLFKRLSWSKASDASSDVHGCDPAVFASQIAEYLETSARDAEFASTRERTARRMVAKDEYSLAAPNAPASEPAADDSTWVEDEAPKESASGEAASYAFDAVEPSTVDEIVSDAPYEAAADTSWTALEGSSGDQRVEEQASDWAPVRADDEAAGEPAGFYTSPVESHDQVKRFDEPVVEPIVDDPEPRQDSQETAADQTETTPVLVENEPVFEPLRSTAHHPSASPEFAWDEIALEDEDDQTIELSSETIDLQAFVHELEAADADPPASETARPEALRVDEDEIDVDSTPVPRGRTAAAYPSERETWAARGQDVGRSPAPEDMAGVVADFVEALEDEPDATAFDADSDLWMALPPGAGGYWPRLDSKCSHPRQTEDEWGFFDPDQCGMSAVIAKLDQMTR